MTSALISPSAAFDRWWTCPPWCDPTLCDGGETVDVDGRPLEFDRIHRRVLANLTVADDDSRHCTLQAQVAIERPDGHDGPGPVDVVLRVGAGGANLTRTQRHQLIAALQAVDALGVEESI